MVTHDIKEFTTLADDAGSENGFRCFGRGSVSDGDSIPPALEHRGQIQTGILSLPPCFYLHAYMCVMCVLPILMRETTFEWPEK